MDFYEAVQKRHTIREFSDEPVSEAAIKRILSAGMLAPSNNLMRDWEFVILKTQEEKQTALRYVKEWADKQEEVKQSGLKGTPAQRMYAYAIPRQYTMLVQAPCLILPFFRAITDILHPSAIHSLNSFASIWCVIENIFLAATAEGYGCSMRIPVGDEGPQAAKAVGAPEGYMLPCYIGIGRAKGDAEKPEQYVIPIEDRLHYGKFSYFLPSF